MSERAIIVAMEDDVEVACILKYHHGGLGLFGRDLAEFLIDYEFVRGMSALSARIIHEFYGEDADDMRILRLGTVLGHEDATYVLSPKGRFVIMEVHEGSRDDPVIYEGMPGGYVSWLYRRGQ